MISIQTVMAFALGLLLGGTGALLLVYALTVTVGRAFAQQAKARMMAAQARTNTQPPRVTGPRSVPVIPNEVPDGRP